MAKIKTIRLLLPFKLGIVNCYLIENDSNYVLIDTGGSNQRTELERQLENAGCKPGHLKLIVITHGDFDHTGNAAYLRHKFAVQVAMHQCDSRMAEYGNMFANRKKPNILIQKIIPILSGFGKKERFKPDILIEEGDDLTAYGLSVNVLSIPGHSEGSIGILMDNSDLFCGDLFENKENPLLNSIMDDIAAAKASVEKLKRLEIKTVYPGHGRPFLLKQFINSN
jgi:glyoxylase-like metal-dependent hydrolase (beta-lactamase superfamily II)